MKRLVCSCCSAAADPVGGKPVPSCDCVILPPCVRCGARWCLEHGKHECPAESVVVLNETTMKGMGGTVRTWMPAIGPRAVMIRVYGKERIR